MAQVLEVALVAPSPPLAAWPRRGGGPAPRWRGRFPCARRSARSRGGASSRDDARAASRTAPWSIPGWTTSASGSRQPFSRARSSRVWLANSHRAAPSIAPGRRAAGEARQRRSTLRPVQQPVVDHHALRPGRCAARRSATATCRPSPTSSPRRGGTPPGGGRACAALWRSRRATAIGPMRGKAWSCQYHRSSRWTSSSSGDRRVGAGLVPVGGQHPHLVSVLAQAGHRRAPHELVPAQVVGRIQVPHGEDAHGGSMVTAVEGGPGDLRSRVREAGPWYHTLDLGEGVVTEGMFDLRPFVIALRPARRPQRHAGARRGHLRRLLGVRDGAPRRAGHEPRPGPHAAAGLAAAAAPRGGRRARAHVPRWRARRSAARSSGSALSVYDATPERLGGPFDLVFCGSVLIHLRDPMLALERMAQLCEGLFVMAEEYSRRLAPLPFVSGRGVPRRLALEHLVDPDRADLGGHGAHRRLHQRAPPRALQLRFRDQRKGVPHVVVHARGAAA